MKSQRKIQFIIIGSFLGLISFLLLVSLVILLRSFITIEQNYAEAEIKRAARMVMNDLADLDRETSDWAEWDDSYNFAQTGNQDFIKKNLPATSFANLQLDIILFVDPAGKIIWGAGFDSQSSQIVPLPQSIQHHLEPHDTIMKHALRGSGIKGFLHLPEGILMLASHAILTSEKKGPIPGILIMGRFFDEKFSGSLSQTLQMPAIIQSYQAPTPSEDYILAKSKLTTQPDIFVHPIDRAMMAGYYLFSDVKRQPCAILRVIFPRVIYLNGLETIQKLNLCFIASICAGALIILRLYNKLYLAKQQSSENEERYHSVVKQATEGILLVHSQTRKIIEGNAASHQLLGYDHSELCQKNIVDIMADEPTECELVLERILKEKREVRFRTKTGKLMDVEVSANIVKHALQDVLCLVLNDMTDRKQYEAQLIHQATHDILSGLPNRSLLIERLNVALAYEDRHKQLLAIMLVDLDNFKIINDTLGHQAGDQLLKDVSRRFQESSRSYDTIARLGGDEFVLMLMDIHDIQNVTKVAEKLLALFSEPFRIMNHEMFVSASIGIALYPNDGSTSEQLLKNADTAMYQVKSHGKNAYQFFTPEMNIKIQDRLHKETKLRRALERQEFVLHYQPRIGLPTGQIIGMEALIRWQPEGQHLIYPLDFIPILEESGMIVSVGEWVLRTACQQNKRWQEQGLGELMIAINISARQFFQQNLIEKIEQILKETDMSPSYLIIELTESIIMHDVEAAIVQLQKLKEMGIHLAIDDFGTGYSSLNYLKRFPVDELKIDKSFINGLLIEKNDASIVMAIIALAHSLEMKVVAEGVEDGNQLNFLMAQKCEEIQGYYFSRPLDRVAFEELVRSGNIRKIQ